MNKIMLIIEKKKKEHSTVEEYHGHIFVDGKKELTTVYTDLVQLRSILEWEINSVFDVKDFSYREIEIDWLDTQIIHKIVKGYFTDVDIYTNIITSKKIVNRIVRWTMIRGDSVIKTFITESQYNMQTIEKLIQKCLLIGGTVK